MKMTTYNIKHIIIPIMCLFALFQACTKKVDSSKTERNQIIPGHCVADTIIYSVVIKNPDPLDSWTENCLSQLKSEQLVNQFFEAVYTHKATAYSYFDDEQLSISDIKEMEVKSDFSRDKIAKLQFWESWYLDEQKQIMTKRVHKILIAYEITNDDGELRGYKAAFYINMKQ